MASLISKTCIEVLLEEQAIMCREGWKIMSPMIAFPEPRLKVCSVSPPSALKILMTVPRYDADAIKVPSGLTLKAPRSVSWAWITLFIEFSATKFNTLIEPLIGFGRAMILDTARSLVAIPQRPAALSPVSTCSMSYRVRKEKMNVLCSRTTISMSFLSLTPFTTLLKEISVRFFLSWSSQITTLWRADERTKTMKFVLYIISTISTDSFKFWIFFLILSLDESFWIISKPCWVATAKYSWLWFEDIYLIVGASGGILVCLI